MKAWVSVKVAAAIADEAGRHGVQETGGMLLGYWSDDTVVVTACIESGPRAERGALWFEPDQEWQTARLAEVYQASGRTTTYLGDWHSHPGGAPYPSWRDRRTLRAVRRSPGARAPRPLMLIVGPHAESPPVLWCLRGRRRLGREAVDMFHPVG